MLLSLAPASLFVQLFDAFSAFSLLFVTFILYIQDGSAASDSVDMQIEAAARMKNTHSDLPALEISRNISFGAPPTHILALACSILSGGAFASPRGSYTLTATRLHRVAHLAALSKWDCMNLGEVPLRVDCGPAKRRLEDVVAPGARRRALRSAAGGVERVVRL